MAKGSKTNELDFEAKLWQAADKLRNNMDAAEYKHVVLGFIFLKYISDAFKELYQKLSNTKGADPEDADEYRAENVFYVPKKARWDYLQKNAKQPTIGQLVDDAMDEIEKDNPTLKGVLPKNYARSNLDKTRLGELIDLIGTIALGDKENRSKDILGRVYEYFLGQFADAEGKKGGQFYTPRSIVKVLVEMLEPYKGRIFDPCCGSGGMFVQSEKFVQAHGGRIGDISIYGQESNQTTWRLCKMNLAIRGIDADIQWNNEGSFLNDAHKDLKADFVIANPPFNDSDWKGDLLRKDARWKYGTPPEGNANFAWVQHFIHHLNPTGLAGFVLANGSMSSNTSGEGEIRKSIIEADLVDAIIAIPDKLFYNTPIQACLWFISRDKKNRKFRDRKGEVLFIDARNMGLLTDRRHRELTDEEIKRISDTYHAWRGEGGKYEDIAGFCKSANLEKIKKRKFKLNPGLYVEKDLMKEKDLFKEVIKDSISKIGNRSKKLNQIKIKLSGNLKQIDDSFKDLDLTVTPNSILENIAHSIFIRWFVDFEFPNEEGRPYKSSGGKMVDSELGDIPKDWKVSTIGKELKTFLGGTPDRTIEEYWKDGTVPWINSGEVNRFRITSPSEYITKEGLEKSATKLLPRKTTVLAITGATLGKISRIEIDCCANQSVVGILESSEIPSEYIYFWVKHIIDEITSWQTGGAQQHINKGNVDDSPILIPDERLLKGYEEIVGPIFEQIALNCFDESL